MRIVSIHEVARGRKVWTTDWGKTQGEKGGRKER